MISKLAFRATLAAVALVAATAAASAQDIAGAYNSSEGAIIFRNDGGNLYQGLYDNDSGQIVGRLDGNVLRGYWMEGSSNVRCDVKMNDTYYWGKIEFGFNGGGFAGNFDYCGQGGGAGWTGQR